jgi:hypothetical protein
VGNWWKIVNRAFSETEYLRPWKAYSSVGGAFVAAVWQYWTAIMGAGFTATAWPLVRAVSYGLTVFIMLSAGEFLFRIFVVVPVELHRELEGKKQPLFHGEIAELRVTNWTEADNSSLSASVLVRVSYHGADTLPPSIYKLQLWLDGFAIGSTRIDRPWDFTGRMFTRRMDFNFPSIPLREVGRARGVGSKWKFTFRDHENNEYASESFSKPQGD